ncbi:MFS transporter [Streptomyces sp. 8K308]|nr:MFS transporter [Streptomyces sp. 8K308]
MLVIVLDGSIVTVAMPAIQEDLGFSAAGLSWVVNAYLIAFGALLLLAGRLGDLLGRRRMFAAGTAVFTGASLLAGFATSPGLLIAARFAQGVGSAMASAVALGILVTLFTEPRERGRAIAAFSFTGATGAAIGQVLGGVLTDGLSWHWIFFINVPLGVAVLVLARRYLPDDTSLGLRAGADAAGAALVTGGLLLGSYAVVNVERYGGTSVHTLGAGLVGLALLAGFLLRQATARTPLMPLRMLRPRAVWSANLIQVLLVGAMFSFQVMFALYLQNVLGYGAAETGLAMLPTAVVIGAVSLGLAARLNARFGELAMLLVGLAMLTALLVLLSRLPNDADYATDLLPVLLLGAGFGLAQPALTTFGMSAARSEDAGLASGLFNTTQQVGMALGIAALSTAAAARTEGLLGEGAGRAEALAAGYRLAFGIGAALLGVAIVVAVAALARRKAGAAPVREREDAARVPAGV